MSADASPKAEHASREQLGDARLAASVLACDEDRPLDNIVRLVTDMFAIEQTIQKVGRHDDSVSALET